MNALSFSRSMVAREGDFYSFIESSVVHLPLIGLAELLVAYREETLHLFLIRHKWRFLQGPSVVLGMVPISV
jgi:hypothetical protein